MCVEEGLFVVSEFELPISSCHHYVTFIMYRDFDVESTVISPKLPVGLNIARQTFVREISLLSERH